MTDTTQQNARVLDQFSRQAEGYAKLVNRSGPPWGDPLLECTQPNVQDRVLDVGCGSGQLAVALAPLVAHVTGIDLTPAMLEQARAHQAKMGLANIEWMQADSRRLPVADGSFSLVVSRSMIHHAADPLGTLAEMRRACVSGGRIAVLDLTPDPDRAAAFDAIELLRDPSHARALPVEELRALGAKLGLEEIALRAHAAELPFESVLATSRPHPGVLERVREFLARDAARGTDVFGLAARLKDDEVWVRYPMTLVVWRAAP
jgi:ubiquinone/menaquinone biosynthesis C-methylase UbiE